MNFLLKLFSILSFFSLVHSQNLNGAYGQPEINPKMLSAPLLFNSTLQAVTNLLNDERVSDIDRLRLVMLYALRYEKESPVQLMQLFNKLASRSAKYKPGVKITKTCFLSSGWVFFCGWGGRMAPSFFFWRHVQMFTSCVPCWLFCS